MLHLMNKLFEAGLTVFSVSVLHHAVVLLLLTHHCGGQPLVVGPSQPVIVNVGDDVILPCHLEPAVDAINMNVEWAKPELNPRFVHVWHGRKDHLVNQHQSYKGRTSVSIESLKHGDISLKLSKVKLSDNGKYRCYFPDLNKDSTVELFVAVPHSFTPAAFYSVSSFSLGVTVTLIVVACCRKKSAERRDDLPAVMELKKELENQKEQLKMQLEMIEREKEENKTLLKSLEKKQNKTVDKQQLIKEKDNLSETRWMLEEKMTDTQKVLIEINKVLQILNAAAQTMSAR